MIIVFGGFIVFGGLVSMRKFSPVLTAWFLLWGVQTASAGSMKACIVDLSSNPDTRLSVVVPFPPDAIPAACNDLTEPGGPYPGKTVRLMCTFDDGVSAATAPGGLPGFDCGWGGDSSKRQHKKQP